MDIIIAALAAAVTGYFLGREHGYSRGHWDGKADGYKDAHDNAGAPQNKDELGG